MMKQNNTRKGFFEHNEFLRLRDALPEYLKNFATFAYKTGLRISEISGLTRKQADLVQGVIRIETGETKNDEARTIYFDEELLSFKGNGTPEKKTGNIMPYVFLNEQDSDKIKRFD